jgi:alpha-galactosidase
MQWKKKVDVAGLSFDIVLETSDDISLNIAVGTEKIEGIDDTFLIRVTVEAYDSRHFHIDDFSISWRVPIVDMHGLYLGGDPRAELGYLPFWRTEKVVAAHKGLPYLALIHRDGRNRAAFGLFDQITEATLCAELSEATRCYHMSIRKPANKDTNQQRIPVVGRWEEVLFVSIAGLAWPDVMSKYVQLVTRRSKQQLFPVPEHAYDPVFCTWTAIHHDVSHDWVMRNAPLAAELGFRTWLTDDGWFIENGAFGDYRHVGEWKPFEGKFPDFKAHVEAVQALGFRYVLWVAPFMIGTASPKAAEYTHLLTNGQANNFFRNLSPWHNETSDIISSLLVRLVRDYELDGLKIDFVDSIAVDSERKPGAGNATLGKSIFDILDTTISKIRELNPELLVEFRNRYTNLASRRYANVYRSSDVPINFTLNRWQAVMLRLLVPDRAVHMDPMFWHPDDTDENVAVHLINGLASVPMVSIALEDYPRTHLDLIRAWIGFYNTHRDTLIQGDFRPQIHPSHIPSIDFVGKDEVITGLYDDVAVSLYSDVKSQWILNASKRPFVELENKGLASYHVTQRDKFGNIISQKNLPGLADRIDVEIGGSLEFRKTGPSRAHKFILATGQ